MAQLTEKYKFVEKFRALFEHGYWSKLFLGGRNGVATAGMVCVFTPAGVMVAWKVLPTPESPYDVVDFVRWSKVGELVTLSVWNTPCEVWGCHWFGGGPAFSAFMPTLRVGASLNTLARIQNIGPLSRHSLCKFRAKQCFFLRAEVVTSHPKSIVGLGCRSRILGLNVPKPVK